MLFRSLPHPSTSTEIPRMRAIGVKIAHYVYTCTIVSSWKRSRCLSQSSSTTVSSSASYWTVYVVSGMLSLVAQHPYLYPFAAHKVAVMRTKLLHRDVSAGNILIYPKVIKAQGNHYLKWCGILADWELSRAVHEPGTPRRPRQPERTVRLNQSILLHSGN